ncbi:MAG: YbjN domain-containing protein, partial [Parvularculaceae bacterium]|nr:YbjN domain-containing protein [Parvularculaceae bacterium]
MKKFLAAAVAAIAAVGVANAQDEISNPRGMVANFDASNLGPVLSELGLVWQQRTTQEGQPYIAASVGGELMINLIPTACSDKFTNCVGLQTIALFPGRDINYQSVLAFGQKYAFTSVMISQDATKAAISRYDIADYGIPRGNVASSLMNFVYLASMFKSELASGAKTVSLKGYAEDFSATSLNSRGLVAISGAHAEQTPRHQKALMESYEIVNVLFQEGEAPRNKIENVG